MPIETSWYDEEHTIILQILHGSWTISELFASSVKLQHEAQGTIEALPRYFIVDMRHSDTLPSGLLAVQAELRVTFDFENTVTVVIGASRFLKVIFNALEQIGGFMQVYFVDNYEEAEGVIARNPLQLIEE